ncbi:GNAT family N-acetyltransferase [Pedobacter sp. KBW06]|uniref:GNAT family N-acetyltransferase n=1 Tax=Pedobacter sp. KBW06 TaxID=2153359 RepID=UPI000F5B0A9D|nr:GNAT family N-acetyltransferase [Pedobacter sp. KBW06]RQO70594.1 GNAT family N-acetyltransferase [Pedobacter sp. KBW06]
MNTRFKKVEASDVALLQEISRKTFLETYAAQNTAENMQHYLDKDFGLESLLAQINNPDSGFHLVWLGDQPAGYLKVNTGLSQTEPNMEQGLEIERIYVLQEFQGMKIGQLLFEHSIAIARKAGKAYIWLGVWEENGKAIAFYQKNGFVQFGTHVFKLGGDEQTDFLMKLDLK